MLKLITKLKNECKPIFLCKLAIGRLTVMSGLYFIYSNSNVFNAILYLCVVW